MVLRLHGYGAWIESDGKPLEEYAVEIKDNVISCHVCSEEGKTFILYFDDDGSHCSGNSPSPHDHGRSLRIEMDGTQIESRWGRFMNTIKADGVHVGDFVRPYVFAPVDTTDDDDAVAGDDGKNEHIGTIQVELKRSTKIGLSGYYNSTEPRTGPVHEKSKKAGSHRVALGEGVYRRQSGKVDVNHIDDTPLVTFRFLYRKRDLLKARGIVPQSPIPSPPPNGSSGPSVNTDGGKKKGKGVKRERDESGIDDVIEISSDDGDLGSLKGELKQLQHGVRQLQERISRKKAKKSVKREAIPSADNTIDLT